MDMKLIGGTLLIVGTTIGGGMLALPVATSPTGFMGSSLLLLFCWFIMTAGAFLILEVNLWLPRNNNVISMAKATLGKSGQAVAWFFYLLLLYSLLAAYIDGGGDFLRNLLSILHIELPHAAPAIIFTLILGYVVFRGIESIDLVNRGLMFIKLGSFVLLIGFIAPHLSFAQLTGGQPKNITMSITVALTSFGFAAIIPSLRIYFQNDINKLRLSILIGSLIPLICYIVWNMSVMGVIPRAGNNGLIKMLSSGHATSAFVTQLSTLAASEAVTTFVRIFTSVCLLTSFLGVALCLSDFLSDGLQIENVGKNKWLINTAAMLPPLLLVVFYPGAFIIALSYAGIYCIILLILLPALMTWSGRYRKNIASGYQVMGGKFLLIFLIAISILLLIDSIVALF